MTPARPRPRLLEFRPMQRGTLLGFASVQFSSGLVLHEIGVHRAGGKTWCAPPARPWVRDGAVITDAASGKPKWQQLISFANHGVRARWSREVLKALAAEYPEAVGETEDAVA